MTQLQAKANAGDGTIMNQSLDVDEFIRIAVGSPTEQIKYVHKMQIGKMDTQTLNQLQTDIVVLAQTHQDLSTKFQLAINTRRTQIENENQPQQRKFKLEAHKQQFTEKNETGKLQLEKDKFQFEFWKTLIVFLATTLTLFASFAILIQPTTTALPKDGTPFTPTANENLKIGAIVILASLRLGAGVALVVKCCFWCCRTQRRVNSDVVDLISQQFYKSQITCILNFCITIAG